jgi:REP element-mobilizing transposase RayT
MPTGYQIQKQEAAYFLTLQVVYWVDIFTRKKYRDIIIENLNYCINNKGLLVYSYVIMSNHVHLLIQSKTAKLSDVLRDFKKYSTARMLFAIQNEAESRRDWLLKLFAHAAAQHKRNTNFQIWTHENHAEEVFSPKFTLQKIQYIHENPVRAGIVEKPEDYIYSSAKNYANGTGLVNVEVLNLHMMMSG